LHVSYEDGKGILRTVLVACTQHDFAISRVRVGRTDEQNSGSGHDKGAGFEEELVQEDQTEVVRPHKIVTVALEVQGSRSIAKLAAKLSEIPGVVSVNATDENIPTD
jgi:putative Mg2+ transporter-C (MgtC) family protein